MSKVLVNDTSLSAIGNAIREKNKTETKYKPAEMGAAILELPTYSGTGTAQDMDIKGDCSYLNNEGRWDWYFNDDNVYTISLVSNANSMFKNSKLSVIPPIDLQYCEDLTSMFYGCNNITELPTLTGYTYYTHYYESSNSNIKIDASCALISKMFSYCYNVRTMPENYLLDIYITNHSPQVLDEIYPTKGIATVSDEDALSMMFYNCYSLRNHCYINIFDRDINGEQIKPYFATFYNCYSLDEIKDCYVFTTLSSITTTFYSFVTNCYRVKDVTFDVSGSISGVFQPRKANWSGQTINLSAIGYGDKAKITGYNSGITEDKEVTDDTTYASLKDDPDWFTQDINYSRYNRLSALNTINSLPDCSEYISENGLTNNVIKFSGESGAKTSGGAINELLESQIAIATAKGFTVSFI